MFSFTAVYIREHKIGSFETCTNQHTTTYCGKLERNQTAGIVSNRALIAIRFHSVKDMFGEEQRMITLVKNNNFSLLMPNVLYYC